jgi:hypothetical protein
LRSILAILVVNLSFAETSNTAKPIKSRSSRPCFNPRYQRIFYLLCAPFIFAFVAFNLLDLDGSDLSSFNHYGERYISLGEPETEFRIKPPTERIKYLDGCFNLVVQRFRSLTGSRNRAPRTPSFLEKARSHLYRVSLPRDAVPG